MRSRTEMIREILRLLRSASWSDLVFILTYLKTGSQQRSA